MLIYELGNTIYEKLLSTFTEPCTVPAWVIHQSADSDDYLIYFQVEEITENLKSGVFVRPSIEIWSGRSDFNRSRLAKELRHEFINQLQVEKQKTIDQHQAELQEISDDNRSSTFSLISNISGLASAIATVLLVSNPIANAVILLLAVARGKEAISDLINILRLSISSWATGKTNEKKEQELEQKLEEKQDAIEGALKNIDVRLHPDLYRAAHDSFGLTATSARGIVLDAEPLPEFIGSLIQDIEYRY